MSLGYSVSLQSDDNNTLLVRSRDLPRVLTYGDTRTEALHRAVDAIETAIASMMDDEVDVPAPEPKREGDFVSLPLLTAFKIQLYRELRAAKVSRGELARRLKWSSEQVDSLFRIDDASPVEQIEAAFRALNRDVTIEIETAA
jgi:antitoxin HicB